VIFTRLGSGVCLRGTFWSPVGPSSSLYTYVCGMADRLCGDAQNLANSMMKRLNYLNDYSVKTTDIDKELENFRIQRDVAIAAMGHTSLTAVPTETPQEKRERLLKLREHAIAKLHRMNRGRRDWAYGLKSGDLHAAAEGDCDEGDAKLGLCGVTVPSPDQAVLTDMEKKVNAELTAKEQKSDEAREKVIQQVDKKRLIKAHNLMDKLSKTDALINELVHHTIKVSQMPDHTPDTTD
jgi:hypothetical protein